MAIPKRIIYCWFGSKEKPKNVQKCIDSWKKYMPDWEYIEINENNFDINLFEFSKAAYDAKVYGFVPDPVRLWALYKYGGIYLDTDVEVYQSFDKLLDNNLFVGVEQPHYFGNATIGATPKNKIIKEVLEKYEKGEEKWELKEDWHDYRTGPMVLTDVLANYVNRDSMEYQKTNDITVYPKKYFVDHEEKDEEVYCKHHMFGSWCKNIKKCKSALKIAFYIPHFNNIGGIESWIYYISRLYGDNRDITVYWSSGDENQINRLRDKLKIRRFYYQKIDCDVAIFCVTIPDTEISCFNAKKERIQFIHAVYSVAYGMGKFTPSPLIDRYIAVSQTAADDFYNLTGVMPKVMFNPIYLEKPRKVLKLISATRISRDKGSIWEKMKILAKKLNAANIPFIWLVFTNNTDVKSDIKNVIFMPSQLKITDYIADADYLIQLSKTEAFAYSLVESLALGTPVLATNFAAASEMGLVDGKTGYIFNMEMDNIDVDKIYNHIPKVEYTIKTSDKEWKELLGPEVKSENKEDLVSVRCIKMEGFKDPETGKRRKYKEVWKCSRETAEYMVNYNNPNSFTNGPLVDII